MQDTKVTGQSLIHSRNHDVDWMIPETCMILLACPSEET